MCSFVIFPMLNLRITPHDPRCNNCYICLLIKSRSPACKAARSSAARSLADSALLIFSAALIFFSSVTRLTTFFPGPRHPLDRKTHRNRNDGDEQIGPNSHSCCRRMCGKEEPVEITCGMCGSLWHVRYVVSPSGVFFL